MNCWPVAQRSASRSLRGHEGGHQMTSVRLPIQTSLSMSMHSYTLDVQERYRQEAEFSEGPRIAACLVPTEQSINISDSRSCGIVACAEDATSRQWQQEAHYNVPSEEAS